MFQTTNQYTCGSKPSYLVNLKIAGKQMFISQNYYGW